MTGHKYALQKMAKIQCVCVLEGGDVMSILLFASGGMHACMRTYVFIVLHVCQDSSCMDVFYYSMKVI